MKNASDSDASIQGIEQPGAQCEDTRFSDALSNSGQKGETAKLSEASRGVGTPLPTNSFRSFTNVRKILLDLVLFLQVCEFTETPENEDVINSVFTSVLSLQDKKHFKRTETSSVQ